MSENNLHIEELKRKVDDEQVISEKRIKEETVKVQSKIDGHKKKCEADMVAKQEKY